MGIEPLLLLTAIVWGLFLKKNHAAQDRLRQVIAIDTRSLGVFRVLLGLLVVVDVFLRLRNFRFFYTDAGVFPWHIARNVVPEQTVSVFFLTDDPAITLVLFGVHAVIGLQLIAGYRTRIATVFSFIFVTSLDARNILVLSYADTLFSLLLFWAVFLPLGERWSIDSIRRDRPPVKSVAGVASSLILLQVVFVYFVNAAHKSGSELWRSGEAMVLVLGLDDITIQLGEMIRIAPPLLEFGGLAWYYLLWFSPLLLILVGRSRALYVAPLLAGHLLLALTVRIGAFPFVSIAALLLFIQAPVWADARAVANRLSRRWQTISVVAEKLVTSLRRAGRWLERRLPRLPTPTVPDRLRAAASVLILAFLLATGASMVVENLQTAGITDADHDLPHQPAVDVMNDAFLIDQPSWTIFAPAPRTVDRYYVFPAETTTGKLVDVYADRPLAFDRPSRALHTQYTTYRHRFYMDSIRRSATEGGYANAHVRLAEFHCETWTGPDGARLEALDMYVVGERVTRPTVDQPSDRVREIRLLYRHGCDEGPTLRDPIQDPPDSVST